MLQFGTAIRKLVIACSAAVAPDAHGGGPWLVPVDNFVFSGLSQAWLKIPKNCEKNWCDRVTPPKGGVSQCHSLSVVTVTAMSQRVTTVTTR